MIAVGVIVLSFSSALLGLFVAFFGSLWPFTVAAVDAFLAVPSTLRESVITLGKGERVYFREVMLMASLPRLFAAVRLVSPITLLLVVTTQYFFPHLGGLGALLYERHSAMDYSALLCVIVMMCGVSVGAEALIDTLEAKCCAWLHHDDARK